MARVVLELKPRAVMMENVPRLAHKNKLFKGFVDTLRSAGYIVSFDILQVADFGTPQQRRRLVMFAGLGFEIGIPKPTHSKTGDAGLHVWRTVRDTIGGLGRPSIFVDVRSTIGNTVGDWHVVRKLSEANILRIKSAVAGSSWMTIPEDLRPACHRGGYRGFHNVYGRMVWDDASPTITSGCTTFSKGRFGHPLEDRTISVREAALLQEFPGDYIFESRKIDHVCSIIGNALPCGFAKQMASHAAQQIRRHPT